MFVSQKKKSTIGMELETLNWCLCCHAKRHETCMLACYDMLLCNEKSDAVMYQNVVRKHVFEQQTSMSNISFRARSTSTVNLTGVLSAKLEQISTFGILTIKHSNKIVHDSKPWSEKCSLPKCLPATRENNTKKQMEKPISRLQLIGFCTHLI